MLCHLCAWLGHHPPPSANLPSRDREKWAGDQPFCSDPKFSQSLVVTGELHRSPRSLTPLCPHPSIARNDLLSAETLHHVIIHHPRGLHMCIADRRAHEGKPPLAQVLAHGI